MSITINLDFADIVSEAVTPERIKPLVENAIRDAIKDAIQHATSYRSKFREDLTKQLSEALPHGLDMGDVAKFQHVLNAAITEAVQGHNAKIVQTALAVAAKEVMPNVPTRIKLSELIKEARDGLHVDHDKPFYAELVMSEYGGGHLYLDDDAKITSHYRAEISIAFTQEGEVYALRLDGRDVTIKSRPDVVGKFKSLLLSMYVGHSSIEIDGDADDVKTWAEPESND